MTIRTLHRAALLAPIALLVACSDGPLEPSFPDGSYYLDRIADHQLPAAVFDGTYVDDAGAEHDVLIQVDGGYLRLTNGGTRYVHFAHLSAWVDGDPSPVSSVNDHGVCTRSASTLTCESEYVENVAFTAEIEGRYLTIVQDLSGEAAPVPHVYFRPPPID